MCGIVGLHLRDPALYPQLGRLLVTMLGGVAERGPDSAGVAVYGDHRRCPAGYAAVSVLGPAPAVPDAVVTRGRRDDRGRRPDPARRPARRRPGRARVVGAGTDVTVYKGTGRPLDLAVTYDLANVHGWQGLAHTRMATESRGRRRRVPPVLGRARPVPGAQRLVRQPRDDPPRAARGGRRVRQRERHRGRRPLRRRPARRGRHLGGRAQGPVRPLRRLLHAARHQRRTASPSSATPSPASRRSSPRPTRGSRWPRSSAPWPSCRGSTARGSGSPSRSGCTHGHGEHRLHGHLRRAAIDLAETPVRALNAELHRPTADAYEVFNPRGAHASPPGCGTRSPSTSAATSATTARA